ncbi:unnamed protein product [Fraxinus pennsylvanica]|uniref:RNA helicase n=1 Tax=Fraxinus pennsylvanica TaxID=56036 RepID=A0AAD2DIM2_9LAMI|nr:unnamed protein product [Fraxinus pennsylvanica]
MIRDKMDIEAVIVAPSRELGMQIVREVERSFLDLKIRDWCNNLEKIRQALKRKRLLKRTSHPLSLEHLGGLRKSVQAEDMHRIIQHVSRRSGAGLPEANGPTTRRADRQTLMVSATVPFSVIRATRSWGCDPLPVQAKNVIPLESVAPRALLIC